MILEEFDREKYEHTIREDGREEGREIGQERVNRLNQILIEQNRIEDLKRSTCDSEYQKTLFKEFDIDKYERTIWTDGFEEGRKEGRELESFESFHL